MVTSDLVTLMVNPETAELQWVTLIIHDAWEVNIPLLRNRNKDDKALKIDKTNLKKAILDVVIDCPVRPYWREGHYIINEQDLVSLWFPAGWGGAKDKTGMDITAYIKQGINKFTAKLARPDVASVLGDCPGFFTATLSLGYTEIPPEPYTVPSDEEEELDWLSLFKPLIQWAPWIIIGFIIVMGLGYVAPLIPRPPKRRREEE